MQKKTKIICTVGPSTDKPGVLENMLTAGMNVARSNFSHGTHEDHKRRIAMVRAAATKVNRPVALLLDTKGPEIRLGKFTEGKANLSAGQSFILTAKEIVGTEKMASVSHKFLYQEVAPGDMILLSDGLITLKTEKIEGQDIITTVQNSGVISDRKRVAVPGVTINLPPLSDQDAADIAFGIEQGMDFVAASFIQRASDVLAIRAVLEEANYHMDIIAKIESMEGVRNIDEILRVADGVMVARGDLGVEIPVEDVPIVQKMIIEKCNKVGKPVITATQMLESMLSNPRPTRAEASDIANAILDGTDAIMLSGETASGQYPAEAVETMSRIALTAEASIKYAQYLTDKGLAKNATTTHAISHASVQIAHELGAGAIITPTGSGYTARMVAKYRPQATIVAVTPHEKILRRMMLLWGVYPLLGGEWDNSDETINGAITTALGTGIIKEGDLVVVTAGITFGMTGTTNMIQVHVVGKVLLHGTGIGQQTAVGKVRKVTADEDFKNTIQPTDILVAKYIDDELLPHIAKVAGIVVEEGGLTSPVAIMAISWGLPLIVGVDGAVSTLQDGDIITIDATSGLIYQGETNAR